MADACFQSGRRMIRHGPIALAGLWALLAASPAAAGELRDLCPDRPGLGTPPCTIDPGHVVVELGIVDWTRDRTPEAREDALLAGDWLVRFGLTENVEAQLGLQSYGHVRTRDRGSGVVTKTGGVGDAVVAIRANLQNPDGSNLSYAIMPFATIPLGNTPIGAGDWGMGLLLPVSYALSDNVSLALTPSVEAAVDEDGSGPHLAFGSVLGLGFALGETISASAEISIARDQDPDGSATEALAGLSFGWQPDKAMQYDAGINLGLNRNSPDAQIYIGIARRF